MLTINYENWGHSIDYLRTQILEAGHIRTRERYFALYAISMGKSAHQVASEIGRRSDTVTGWVHRYNSEGEEGIIYRRTGGRPLFCPTKLKMISPLL